MLTVARRSSFTGNFQISKKKDTKSRYPPLTTRCAHHLQNMALSTREAAIVEADAERALAGVAKAMEGRRPAALAA